jgi:hypothetical protein
MPLWRNLCSDRRRENPLLILAPALPVTPPTWPDDGKCKSEDDDHQEKEGWKDHVNGAREARTPR